MPKPREIDESADACRQRLEPESTGKAHSTGNGDSVAGDAQIEMDRRENEPIANDLKVSDSSGSDRNPLRLPSERLLRRIDRAEPAAAPGEVVLSEEAAAMLEKSDCETRSIKDKLLDKFEDGLARLGRRQ